jgi:hypothetical protein
LAEAQFNIATEKMAKLLLMNVVNALPQVAELTHQDVRKIQPKDRVAILKDAKEVMINLVAILEDVAKIHRIDRVVILVVAKIHLIDHVEILVVAIEKIHRAMTILAMLATEKVRQWLEENLPKEKMD